MFPDHLENGSYRFLDISSSFCGIHEDSYIVVINKPAQSIVAGDFPFLLRYHSQKLYLEGKNSGMNLKVKVLF